MAIKLRQTATLNDEFEYVSKLDEAVDDSADDFDEKWKRYREGAGSELPLKDGKEPTVWRLKPIADNRTMGHLSDLLQREGHVTCFIQAAAIGVVGAQNLELAIKRERIDGHQQLTEEVINAIPVPILVELGSVIMEHSNPNQD